MRFSVEAPLVVALAVSYGVQAGPLAYGACQTGCNGIAVACYAAAGFTFGTIAAPAAPPAILACNSALGACSAVCAAIALTPTP